jgi:hypothetical protein
MAMRYLARSTDRHRADDAGFVNESDIEMLLASPPGTLNRRFQLER